MEKLNRTEPQTESNGDDSPLSSEGKSNFKGISTKEYFNERYQEDSITGFMLDGCLKMIEGYFMVNNIIRKVEKPINHPINLDQVVDERFGFEMYCAKFNLDKQKAALFLALALNDFLVANYGFKLYKDLKPEFPLRTMTSKYDEDGLVLSIYPFEYAMKVLDYEANFEELKAKIDANIKDMSRIKEAFDEGGDA